jgi:hypothetical protein
VANAVHASVARSTGEAVIAWLITAALAVLATQLPRLYARRMANARRAEAAARALVPGHAAG